MNDQKSEYFDSDGTPKLRLSYCVYMDILGFTEIVSDSFREKQGDALLRKLHGILSLEVEQHDLETNLDIIPDSYTKLFTDNVVTGHIISSSDGEFEFGSVILQAIMYQLHMALAGFFTRGAITIGEMFIDDKIVFGPALIEAYNIEQTIARDPRIVLSKQLFKLVKRHMKYYGEPFDSPQNSHLLIDSDGNPFVNYLSFLFEDIESDYDKVWSYLRTHKQSIENGLLKYGVNPPIWSKYQWLSNYHNFFCQECSELPGYDEQILISQELANRRPTRIIKSRTRKPKRIY